MPSRVIQCVRGGRELITRLVCPGWTSVLLYVSLLGLLVASPVVYRLAALLRDDKPGIWGTYTWYLLLLVGYNIFVSLLLLQTISLAACRKFTWRRWAVTLLGLTLVRGLLYGSIIPPWQAPDEHAHFEYAALLARLGRVPTLRDVSTDLQREIAQSMFEYDFWRLIRKEPVAHPPEGFIVQFNIDPPPNHVVDNRYLYYPQVESESPLYYAAPALIYALIPRASVTLQLYAMRLASVVLLVGLMGSVLWGSRICLRCSVVILMVVSIVIGFQPMLAHIGSVLSNDVLGAVLVTVVLGLLCKGIRSGWRGGAIVLIAVLTVLSFLAKRTNYWLVLLLCFLLAAYGWRHRKWVRYGILVGLSVASALLGIALGVSSGHPRYWSGSFIWDRAVAEQQVVDGERSFRVVGQESSAGVLEQIINFRETFALRGQHVALRAWVMGNIPAQGELAIFDEDRLIVSRQFVSGGMWQIVEVQGTVPDDARRLRVEMRALPGSVLYFDNLTLSVSGDEGDRFVGLRNASAEEVQSLAEYIATRVSMRVGLWGLGERLSANWRSNLTYLLAHPPHFDGTFRSFWGNFGAALVVPLPDAVYKVMRCLCGLSALGIFLRGIVFVRRKVPLWATRTWQSIALLGMALLLAFVQNSIVVIADPSWVPQGRFLFGAIWPIAVLLSVGWFQIFPFRLRLWLPFVTAITFLALDLIALSTIVRWFLL